LAATNTPRIRRDPDARETALVAILGLLSAIIGSAAAYSAQRFPAYAGAHVEALETGAGMLLIGGLALAACGLPVVL
jgi:hypothetical protein